MTFFSELSTVDTRVLLQCELRAMIHTSDFNTLRKHCLDVKPIAHVVQNVMRQLHETAARDRQAYQHLLTETAFDLQREEDKAQEASDKQNAQLDDQQRALIIRELPKLQSRFITVESQLGLQKNECRRISNILEKATKELQKTENSIQKVTRTLQMLSQPYASNYVTHVTNSWGRHHQHFHNSAPIMDSLASMIQRNNLNSELNILRSKKGSLQSEIDSLEAQSTSAERQRSNLLSEQQHLKKSITDMKFELEFNLPERQRVREQRAGQRLERKNARSANPDSIKQLSDANRVVLNQNSAAAFREIDAALIKLNHEVTAMSHESYIMQLSHELNYNNGIEMPFPQYTALLSITDIMNQYHSVDLVYKAKTLELAQAQNRLLTEQQQLAELHRQKEGFVLSGPKLEQERVTLNKELEQLKDKQRSAEYQYNIGVAALQSFLIVLTITIALGILLPSYFLPSVILGSIFAVGSIASGITTLVGYNRRGDDDIRSKIQEITTLEGNLQTHKKQSDATFDTIPVLEGQLSETKTSISQLEEETKEYAQALEQLLHKANSVSSNSNNANGFYRPSAPTLQSLNPYEQPPAPKASAPDIKEYGFNYEEFVGEVMGLASNYKP